MSTVDHVDRRFSLRRPFSADFRQWAEPSYPYASRGDGSLLLHTGVDFINPLGTPVLSAGAGKVFFAGDDSDKVLGPTRDYYGKMVLIQLDLLHQDKSVFVLYGHLDQVWVHSGSQVLPGQPIGTVGETGIATGPHLHFEVRLGDSTLASTSNPEMWLDPLALAGTVVGRVLDTDGNPLPGVRVVFAPATNLERPWYTTATYLNESYVHSDDQWNENFLLADVPVGEYVASVFYQDQVDHKRLHVGSGKVVFFETRFEVPFEFIGDSRRRGIRLR